MPVPVLYHYHHLLNETSVFAAYVPQVQSLLYVCISNFLYMCITLFCTA
jgi:hypothetical protein